MANKVTRRAKRSIREEDKREFTDALAASKESAPITTPLSNEANAEMYTQEYYRLYAEDSYRSGKVVLSMLKELYDFRSVIDFGSGAGTWLSAARLLLSPARHTLLGLDGEWARCSKAYTNQHGGPIPFKVADLNKRIDVVGPFDLAISVEVAEHLEPTAAELHVESLVSVSDVVLFAAAIPGQGGTGHINEQWPIYWAAIFESFDYVPLDCLRPRLWQCGLVNWWYTQNLIVYVKRSKLVPIYNSLTDPFKHFRPYISHLPVMNLIHPELYKTYRNQLCQNSK